MVGAGPPTAPAARARTGSVAGPVAGLSRDLASGIIGDLAASLAAGISIAVCFFSSIFRVMRLHEPLGPPYTKKSDFFNERILINGRRRLSKHAPRHLPPIFFFNRARFRRERADLVPFIWVLLCEALVPRGS